MLFYSGTSVLIDFALGGTEQGFKQEGYTHSTATRQPKSAPGASMDTQTGCPETFYMYRKSIAFDT